MRQRLMATFLLIVLAACGTDSLGAEAEITLQPGEATRVVVVLAASSVKDSWVSFDVFHDNPTARVRIVPDDVELPILETKPDATRNAAAIYDDIARRCQRRGDCSLGFTLDVLEADGPVALNLRAKAVRPAPYDDRRMEIRELE